ncbi:MAG: lipoate--protein ligase family protein [Candidatus Omnitrophica bacterium]|nr:lipoate--protein ligase family protein [Candidatus Omnitrophota bacterium]
MALDEAILRGYSHHSAPPTLRIYGWKPAALSIGYSQDPGEELDLERCLREPMPFVRRLTGGGIILHDDELTYSLVCSKEDLGIPRAVLSSYSVICSFLIEFYKALGIDAAFARDVITDEALGSPSALCFAAKEKHDIVISGRKIGGNAQKRTRNIIFQHGSIPLGPGRGRETAFLRRAPAADIARCSISLEEAAGRRLATGELSPVLIGAFERSFNLKLVPGRLSDTEKTVFLDLLAMKYRSDDWNYRRMDGIRYAAGMAQ